MVAEVKRKPWVCSYLVIQNTDHQIFLKSWKEQQQIYQIHGKEKSCVLWFAEAIMTNSHKVGPLKHRYLLPHSSASWEPNIKVSVGWTWKIIVLIRCHFCLAFPPVSFYTVFMYSANVQMCTVTLILVLDEGQPKWCFNWTNCT